MSAPNLPQGAITNKSQPVTATLASQVTASGTDTEILRFTLPYVCRLERLDFALTVAGSSGTVTDLKLTDGTNTLSEAVAPAAGAGLKTGSLSITDRLKAHAKGTVFYLTCDTAANSTVEAKSCATLTVTPIRP